MEAGDLSNAFAKIPSTKTANGVLLWLPLLENLVHLSTLQLESNIVCSKFLSIVSSSGRGTSPSEKSHP